jgi:hypothetical protein
MEYCDSKLLTFLSEQDTLSAFSCPYTSQQNGRTERKRRHILDSIYAMLISASCPKPTWGEATLTVVHIINRLPSFVLGNVSPFEHLYLTKLDYNSLKVLVVHVLSSFSPMNILNLSLVPVYVLFLVMALNTWIIDVETQYLNASTSLAMLYTGNT